MSIESIQSGSAPPSRLASGVPAPKAPERARETTNSVAPQDNQTQDRPQLSLEEAVKHISKFVSMANSEISFAIDKSSGLRVVQVKDVRTDELIRQIPSEEAIQIAQALDKLQGLFVKESA